MQHKIEYDKTYSVSENTVCREIDGEFLIIPILSDNDENHGDMYSLNQSGRSIWHLIDGSHSVQDIIDLLKLKFSDDGNDIEKDVKQFFNELLKRKILIRNPD